MKQRSASPSAPRGRAGSRPPARTPRSPERHPYDDEYAYGRNPRASAPRTTGPRRGPGKGGPGKGGKAPRDRRPAGEPRPGAGRIIWRVLTHNATILTVVIVGIVVAALSFGPGTGTPPKDAAGLSANDAARAMTVNSADVVDNMDPTIAGAVAQAKERAYKEQKRKEAEARRLADKRKREAMIRAEKERQKKLLEAMQRNPSVAENKAYAKKLNAAKGWSGCWSSLETIWTKESTWNERAENTSSGAYGIPQALPGSKMASVGADWRTNAATQIKWGLSYIGGRYGDPCKAWSWWQAHHWY